MRVLNMRALARPEDDHLSLGESVNEMYGALLSRANAALRTAGVVLGVVAVLWVAGGVVLLVGLFLLGRYYLKHHRIPGTLVKYKGEGDWVIVALPDGTEITAHCTLADLPEGSDVVVAIRRGSAYVVVPPIRYREPEDEVLVEVVEQ